MSLPKIRTSLFLSGIFFADQCVHMSILVPGIQQKWPLMYSSGYQNSKSREEQGQKEYISRRLLYNYSQKKLVTANLIKDL